MSSYNGYAQQQHNNMGVGTISHAGLPEEWEARVEKEIRERLQTTDVFDEPISDVRCVAVCSRHGKRK